MKHFIIKPVLGTTKVMSRSYLDEQGMFGEPGDIITEDDLQDYWDNNKDDDPCLSYYGDDYQSWLRDTERWLEIVDTDSIESATIVKKDTSDLFTFMNYVPGDSETGIEGDEFYPMCYFHAKDIDDARDQASKYCEDNGLDSSEYYADFYNDAWEDELAGVPVFDTLADFSNYENDDVEDVTDISDLEPVEAIKSSAAIPAKPSIECSDSDRVDYGYDNYEWIATKDVMDSDGFTTDYTMYRDRSTGEYVFVFGDKDIYTPESGYFDYECESEEEAWEWFDSYEGFVDDEDDFDADYDDIDSSTNIKASLFCFGEEEAEKYGDLICEKLAGKTVSKRRDKGEQPGGLIYEANELGIDMWDLLKALEGLCCKGRATEIDDSTYKVLGCSEPSSVDQQ